MALAKSFCTGGRVRATAGLVLGLAMFSCATPQRRAVVIRPFTKMEAPVAITLPSSLRVVHYTATKYCAEPVPDVALGNSLAFLAKASKEASASTDGISASLKGSGEFSGNYAVTVSSLAGRTQVVLVAREALYRLCEAFANGAINKGKYAKSIQDVLKTVETVARAAEKVAEAAKTSADAKKALVMAKLSKDQRRVFACGDAHEKCKKDAKGDANKLKKCDEDRVKCLKGESQ